MVTRLVVPAVNGSAQSVLHAWWAESGDWVNEGDRICTLMHSPYAVTLRAIESGFWKLPDQATPEPGMVVHRGQLLGWILAPGSAPERSEEVHQPPAVHAIPWSVKRDAELVAAARQAAGNRPPASPRARRRARELQLDLSSIATRDSATPFRESDILDFSQPQGATETLSPALFQTELRWTSVSRPTPDGIAGAALACLSKTASSLRAGCLIRWEPSGWTMDFFESPAEAAESFRVAGRKKRTPEALSARGISWLVCDAVQSPFDVWFPGSVSHRVPRAAVVIVLGTLRQATGAGPALREDGWAMKVTITCYSPLGVSVPWDAWLTIFKEQLEWMEQPNR